MIEKMVVGVDGSATAAAAARQAAALANLFGAEVVAATASGRLLGVTAERAREQLEGPWTAPLREAAAKHRTVVLEGDPRVMLAELAEEEGADLVVVGSSGVGWYPAARVGHVAHYLAHHGGQPLLIVPGERPAELRRLAVGLDGSEGSAAALDWASDVAAAADGELLGVHVHQPAASAGRRVEDPGWRQAALDDVEARLAPLAAEGLNVLALVEEGDPARTLAQVGSREHADLLVLGRRGAGGFHGLHLGSVALRVLHETAVPVVLIPPTAA